MDELALELGSLLGEFDGTTLRLGGREGCWDGPELALGWSVSDSGEGVGVTSMKSDETASGIAFSIASPSAKTSLIACSTCSLATDASSLSLVTRNWLSMVKHDCAVGSVGVHRAIQERTCESVLRWIQCQCTTTNLPVSETLTSSRYPTI